MKELCHRLGPYMSWTQLSHNIQTELRCLRHTVMMAMEWKPEAGAEFESIYDPSNLHSLCNYNANHNAVIANNIY